MPRLSLTVDADLQSAEKSERKCKTLTRDVNLMPEPGAIKRSRSGTIKKDNRKSMAACNDAGKFLLDVYGVSAPKPENILRLTEWKSLQIESESESESESENESGNESEDDSDFLKTK